MHLASWGLSGEEASNEWGGRKTFIIFARHIFRTFRAEANIIMQGDELPCELSNDPKMCDLQ